MGFAYKRPLKTTKISDLEATGTVNISFLPTGVYYFSQKSMLFKICFI